MGQRCRICQVTIQDCSAGKRWLLGPLSIVKNELIIFISGRILKKINANRRICVCKYMRDEKGKALRCFRENLNSLKAGIVG